LTDAGDALVAAAGDWWASDDSPRADGSTREWSIGQVQFAAMYRPVAGSPGVFERIGEIWARPSEMGEVIQSLEGAETALESDWVVRDDDGNQWLVPDAHFVKNYVPAATGADGDGKSW
jgi:hypothetical protein